MLISLIGIVLSFAVLLLLIAKGVDMALSLVVGTIIAGFFLPLTMLDFMKAVIGEISNPTTIQLVIAVSLISGLGQAMRQSGDLDLIVRSLVGLLKSDKLLCMLIPALFGTLNVPGGAMMSAPLVEQSASRLELSPVRMGTINVFFRHIGYFIYPLFSTTILMSELMGTERLEIIKHNVLIMLVGLTLAYFLYFGNVQAKKEAKGDKNAAAGAFDLLLGLMPVLVMLVIVAVFNLPFYLGAIGGVLAALGRGLPSQGALGAWLQRLKRFLWEWVDYRLTFTILGIMAFKGVIEYSGVINEALAIVLKNGVSLPLLVVGAGVAVAYATGVPLAAAGLLTPLFMHLFPPAAHGPYVALLFTSIVTGYMISPLHLCLTLSNQYYGVSMWPVYKKLFWPLSAMLLTAILQVYV